MAMIVVKLGDTVVQQFQIDKEVVSIGRARDNDVIVENLSVSRNHARVRVQDGKFILTDLNSANGCFVNGVKVTKTELQDDDIISIGKHKLHFINRASQAASVPASAAAPPPSAAVVPPSQAPTASKPMIAPAAPVLTPSTPAPTGGATIPEGQVAALVVTRGKQTDQIFRVQNAETSIGRSNENDVRLHDWFVSKRHATILMENGRCLLRDLGSWRGTTVNGETIKERALNEGDELIFGTTVLKFKIGPPDMFVEDATADYARQNAAQDERESDFVALQDDYELPGSDTSGMYESAPAGKPAARAAAPSAAADDDEFAPMTDEELEALEMEADDAFEVSDKEIAAAAEWEQLEAEKMLKEGAGWGSGGSLIEDDSQLRAQEEASVRKSDSRQSLDEIEFHGDDVEVVDEEEEKALFGGPVTNAEPGSAGSPSSSAEVRRVEAVAPAATVDEAVEIPEGVDPEVVAKWTRALKNKSKVIRREAARKLKELTGVDYDWESDPQ